MPESVIPVLCCFARSGGTLVNQLLGVHPDCLVLSEVNPSGSVEPIEGQAKNWLGLITTEESQFLHGLAYSDQLRWLHERTSGLRKHLIVRDWVTINFLTGATAVPTSPSRVLEQVLYLDRAGLEPRVVVITRRASEVYRSIITTFQHLGTLSARTFGSDYLAYARAVARYPIVRLEDLRGNPERTLSELLRLLNVSTEHVAMQLSTFHTYRHCTGNTMFTETLASAAATAILPMSSDRAAANSLDRDSQDMLTAADRVLGYE